ncbi:hypothetical protein DPMN_031737 [Dreissena polymorpha]|uniref:Uncharacterized protein n=1 Tax=Dreissena polymorpha TaxID=45954 RepID=A0A9D4M3N9_DREPO|nr:hypothetical protein DPMN_031737 [Dreissena polymorpha]
MGSRCKCCVYMLHGKRSSLPTSSLTAIFNDDDDENDDSLRKAQMKSVDEALYLPYSILATIFNDDEDVDNRHRTRTNSEDDPCSPLCQWFLRIG